MKKLVFTVLIIAFSNFANSAKQEDGLVNDFKAVNNINNKSSLQRGAKYFVNYCSGCHSLKYMRMSTLANDLDIDEETFFKNLMFSDKKIGETMTIAMKESDALLWFNAVPPDLSLTARSKGADYIYAKLNTYYEDDSAITGYNNLALPNSSMPNILAGLQGGQKIILDAQNNPVSLEKISEGKYSEEEYKQLTNDITNFLVYVSEPAKLKDFQWVFGCFYLYLFLLS